MVNQGQLSSKSGVIGQVNETDDDAVTLSEPYDSFRMMPVSAIQVPPHQPRRYFDPQKMEQLTYSIKTHGILENLLVRPLEGGNYELVAGERRLRAAIAVGLAEVPVTVRELTDEQAFVLALVENLQRADLNPIEETEGVLRLVSTRLKLSIGEAMSLLYHIQHERRGQVAHNIIGSPQYEEIVSLFNEIGRFTWESFVVNRMPLLKLPIHILELVRSGELAYTKAQVISRVKDETFQSSLLQETVEQKLSLSDIRKRIRGNSSNPLVEAKLPQDILDRAYKRIRSSKAWEDPEKRERVKELLQELSSLIGD
ncbi:MAG TPA: ParB/RepB/Spo0J family partition protein [Coleofasciculaceae cyanobacterium]|jgi:ParB family chromosome partitioning protein